MKKKTRVFLKKERINITVNITNSDKPEIDQAILKRWQRILDLITIIIDVPSGLIMKITEHSMKVFLKSCNAGNLYKKGGCDELGIGLYCETVIGTNSQLLIENAVKNSIWDDNPDIKLNMVSYYGLPLQWPDDEIFGTICMLDNKQNAYGGIFKNLILEFKLSIEKDLELLLRENNLRNTKFKLKDLNENLEKKVGERTKELENLNIALTVLLKKRENDKIEFTERIFSNYEMLILPFLNELKNSQSLKEAKATTDILGSILEEIITPFSKKLSDPIRNLTSAEIQIASFIKKGVTNKEIAQTLNISFRTVANHRHNIRAKLDLVKKKINLRSYLSNL